MFQKNLLYKVGLFFMNSIIVVVNVDAPCSRSSGVLFLLIKGSHYTGQAGVSCPQRQHLKWHSDSQFK